MVGIWVLYHTKIRRIGFEYILKSLKNYLFKKHTVMVSDCSADTGNLRSERHQNVVGCFLSTTTATLSPDLANKHQKYRRAWKKTTIQINWRRQQASKGCLILHTERKLRVLWQHLIYVCFRVYFDLSQGRRYCSARHQKQKGLVGSSMHGSSASSNHVVSRRPFPSEQ